MNQYLKKICANNNYKTVLKGIIMKILVKGANGYLGRGIIKSILDSGNQVIASDFITDYIDSRAKVMECNLFDINNPYNYFEQLDEMFNSARREGFVHYSNAHIEDLPKHHEFLKSLAEAGIKQFVVMGSMHEIRLFEGSINENTPCKPTTPYGIA